MSQTVSVIIPAWRSAATIGRALRSVAAQTVKPLEVIVIDDGSDDGSFEAAEACREMMNGIHLVVIRQDNKGAGAARNAGVRAAKGEWLAFLDADDEWLPNKLERSLAHAEGASLIAHDYIEVKGGHETPMDCTRHFRAAEDPFAALMLRGFIPSITVLARRADVLAVGGFEESLPAAQDYDLWLKLLSLPDARLAMFPEALARYYVSGTGITSQVEQRRRCSMRVLMRHLEQLSSRPNALLTAWRRVMIIHYEALAAHREQGKRLAALISLRHLPISMIRPLLALRGAELALVHGLAVTTAYLWFSRGYYMEKLSVFSQFLLPKMTGFF
ncbi:MAG: glycosyltransferase family 2 protein [Alphaproteobacteria bacterium]|nr:glycosyltransferase family 2 protein [Alphaproteobacteria bacterium]